MFEEETGILFVGKNHNHGSNSEEVTATVTPMLDDLRPQH